MHLGLLLRVTSRVVADECDLHFRVVPGPASRDGFGPRFYDALGTTTMQARQDDPMVSLCFSTSPVFLSVTTSSICSRSRPEFKVVVAGATVALFVRV